MEKFIKQKQLRWWGHKQRMSGEETVKKIWEDKQEKRKTVDQNRRGTLY